MFIELELGLEEGLEIGPSYLNSASLSKSNKSNKSTSKKANSPTKRSYYIT